MKEKIRLILFIALTLLSIVFIVITKGMPVQRMSYFMLILCLIGLASTIGIYAIDKIYKK